MNTNYEIQHALSVDASGDGSWFAGSIKADHASYLPRVGDEIELLGFTYHVVAVFHRLSPTEYAPGRVLGHAKPIVRVK